MSTTIMSEQKATDAIDGARAALKDAIANFNSRRYDAYFTVFTEDVESYTGIVTPLRWNGLSHWKQMIGGVDQMASANFELREATYRSYNDDTVLANGYFVFTTVSPSGAVETQTGRTSITLVKAGGAWRVANQHYSPFF